eukprot:scaffold101244_cov25-Prasinocladus_malaysianus.AAC.1
MQCNSKQSKAMSMSTSIMSMQCNVNVIMQCECQCNAIAMQCMEKKARQCNNAMQGNAMQGSAMKCNNRNSINDAIRWQPGQIRPRLGSARLGSAQSLGSSAILASTADYGYEKNVGWTGQKP